MKLVAYYSFGRWITIWCFLMATLMI